MSPRIAIIVATLLAGTASAAQLSDQQLVAACIGQYIHEHLSNYPGKIRVEEQSSNHYQPLLAGPRRTVAVTAYHNGKYLGEANCEVRGADIVLSEPDANSAAKLAQLPRSSAGSASVARRN